MYVPRCCKQKVNSVYKQRKLSNFDTNTLTQKDIIEKDCDLNRNGAQCYVSSV